MMIGNCLLFLFMMSGSAATNAAEESYVQKGDKLMAAFCFDLAAEQYKTATDRDTNDVVAWEKLGNAYLILDDYKNAEPVYKVLSTHPLAKPIDRFYYGQVLRANGKYAEAQNAYNAFREAAPNDSRAVEFKGFYDAVNLLAADNKSYTLTPFAQNTSASEMSPAFCGDKIILSSNRKDGNPVHYRDIGDGEPFYDLYEMKQPGTDTMNIPVKLKGKVNGRLNEGPATFSADTMEMIFTQTNYITKGTDHISKLGLYHADYNKKKGWINIRPLPCNSYTYDVAHPSLTADGKKLYFISDMPGGFGETDIYVMEKTGNTWGSPVNLGAKINTPGREMFPFAEGSNKLYFSSDTRVGLGGLDIYLALLDDTVWNSPLDLGAPINSVADDFGFITDSTKTKGLFVSNRTGGQGSDDIYGFVHQPPVSFNLYTINFDSISTGLRADAGIILDSIVLLMKIYPDLVLEISAHTDARGNSEFNLILSQQRAATCKAYFTERGIGVDRIKAIGYGEERLKKICVDCTDAEHAVNRRAEFRLMKVE